MALICDFPKMGSHSFSASTWDPPNKTGTGFSRKTASRAVCRSAFLASATADHSRTDTYCMGTPLPNMFE
jgi:hypothetical protein